MTGKAMSASVAHSAGLRIDKHLAKFPKRVRFRQYAILIETDAAYPTK